MRDTTNNGTDEEKTLLASDRTKRRIRYYREAENSAINLGSIEKGPQNFLVAALDSERG